MTDRMHWTLKARPTTPAACFWPPCVLPLPTRRLALVSESSVQSIRSFGPAARASARRRAGKAGPASCVGFLTAQAAAGAASRGKLDSARPTRLPLHTGLRKSVPFGQNFQKRIRGTSLQAKAAHRAPQEPLAVVGRSRSSASVIDYLVRLPGKQHQSLVY